MVEPPQANQWFEVACGWSFPVPSITIPGALHTQHRDSREIPVTAESIRTRSSATSSRLHAWRAEKSSASLTHMDEPLTPTSPIRLLLHGANGRMGQALLRLAAEQPDAFTLVGAVSRKVGQRVIDGVPQFASSELTAAPDCDVVVDFSLPEAFDGVLAYCVEHGRALVSGTTGFRTRNAPRSMRPASASRVVGVELQPRRRGARRPGRTRRARVARMGRRHRRSSTTCASSMRRRARRSPSAMPRGRAARSRATHRCAPATSSASTPCNSPRWASASS